MKVLPVLLLAAVFALLAAGDAGVTADPRTEYFVLERPGEIDELTGERRPEVVGVSLRRHTQGGPKELLECETLFADGPVRTLHVQVLGTGPRLVWRELGPDASRTWLVEWDVERERLNTTTWAGGSQTHAALGLEQDTIGPLALVEAMRTRKLEKGRVTCLAPLSGTLEELRLTRIEHPEQPTMRTVEWRRKDDSLAGRYTFRGADLVSFQWQEGDLRARAVDRETHRGFEREWTLQARRTRAASASRQNR